MERTLSTTRRSREARADLEFWLSQPVEARLAALETLRAQAIGLEDFKTNKRASGRLKDLADLEALEPPQED